MEKPEDASPSLPSALPITYLGTQSSNPIPYPVAERPVGSRLLHTDICGTGTYLDAHTPTWATKSETGLIK